MCVGVGVCTQKTLIHLYHLERATHPIISLNTHKPLIRLYHPFHHIPTTTTTTHKPLILLYHPPPPHSHHRKPGPRLAAVQVQELRHPGGRERVHRPAAPQAAGDPGGAGRSGWGGGLFWVGGFVGWLVGCVFGWLVG